MNVPMHVLVVDADADFSKRVCRTLEQATEHDYQVSVCQLGIEAIASCRWQHFDCVIVDFVMPDMSGARVVEQIRGILDKETSPIIFMAAERIPGCNKGGETTGSRLYRKDCDQPSQYSAFSWECHREGPVAARYA